MATVGMQWVELFPCMKLQNGCVYYNMIDRKIDVAMAISIRRDRFRKTNVFESRLPFVMKRDTSDTSNVNCTKRPKPAILEVFIVKKKKIPHDEQSFTSLAV